jgi:hypothetical protein
VKLTPREEGGLNPMYWPGIDAAFGPATTLARDGRSMSDAAFMVTATVELMMTISGSGGTRLDWPTTASGRPPSLSGRALVPFTWCREGVFDVE